MFSNERTTYTVFFIECEKSNNSSLIPDHDVCELNESNSNKTFNHHINLEWLLVILFSDDYISEEEEEKNKQTIDPMYEEQVRIKLYIHISRYICIEDWRGRSSQIFIDCWT